MKGKKIALLVHTAGEMVMWMRDWEERMTSAGATVVNGRGSYMPGKP